MFSSALYYANAASKKVLNQIRPQSPSSDTVEMQHPNLVQMVNTPRKFELLIKRSAEQESTPLNFYVFGCGGDGGDGQKDTAKLLAAVTSADKRPDFIIILGDTFYDDGVDSVMDAGFKEKFYDVYHDPVLQTINRIPYFVIMGNHDHALHRGPMGVNYPEGKTEFRKVAAQVEHTVCQEAGVRNRIYEKLYASSKLELDKLPRWNMPSRFYTIRWKNIEMFFIDSNTYIRDYLELRSGDSAANNQALWLQREALKSDTIKLLFMHHPMVTVGKRAVKNPISEFWRKDINIYLNDVEISDMKMKHGIEGNYSEMLRMTMQKQGLVFDSVFAAHDHMMTYHLDLENKYCQLVLGGGGGKLQHRKIASGWRKMPFCAREFGFASVHVFPDSPDHKIIFDLHYSPKAVKRVRFNNSSVEPARPETDMDDTAENRQRLAYLRDAVLTAYQKYMDNLQANETTSNTTKAAYASVFHGANGLERADRLRNFFNNFTPKPFAEAAEFVKSAFDQHMFGASADSLITYFNLELNKFGINHEQFCRQPESIFPGTPGFDAVIIVTEGAMDSRLSPEYSAVSGSRASASSSPSHGGRMYMNEQGVFYRLSFTNHSPTLFGIVTDSPPLLALRNSDSEVNLSAKGTERSISLRTSS